MLQHLLDRSGVIREPALGRVDFVHRTFQEYLAAKEATEDQPVDTLVTRAHLDQWWETVVMAVGHATPDRRAALLAGVLDRADAELRHCRRLRLLAAACLDTAQVIHPEITHRIEAALEQLVPPRGQRETRSLALAGNRVLRRLPTSLDGLSDASAAACVQTAAWVGGPEAQSILARWAPDPRGTVQRALAQAWRYFDPSDYAEAVLQDAPLDNGKIKVELFEHVPYLRKLQHLRDVWLGFIDAGKVDDLDFLRYAPPVTTSLEVRTSRPVDLAPLTSCPSLKMVNVLGGGVSSGWELLTLLPALQELYVNPPDGGYDLSLLADCPSLIAVFLHDCSALSDLSALASAASLSHVGLFGASRLWNLRALTGLPELKALWISEAPLADGVATMAPVLNQLKTLYVSSAPTVTSLDALAGSALTWLNLADCPITDLTPLGASQSLMFVYLQRFPCLSLTPLASLPQLRKVRLIHIDEPVDLSPFAQIDHRIRIELSNTSAVGMAGPLVKILRS